MKPLEKKMFKCLVVLHNAHAKIIFTVVWEKRINAMYLKQNFQFRKKTVPASDSKGSGCSNQNIKF